MLCLGNELPTLSHSPKHTHTHIHTQYCRISVLKAQQHQFMFFRTIKQTTCFVPGPASFWCTRNKIFIHAHLVFLGFVANSDRIRGINLWLWRCIDFQKKNRIVSFRALSNVASNSHAHTPSPPASIHPTPPPGAHHLEAMLTVTTKAYGAYAWAIRSEGTLTRRCSTLAKSEFSNSKLSPTTSTPDTTQYTFGYFWGNNSDFFWVKTTMLVFNLETSGPYVTIDILGSNLVCDVLFGFQPGSFFLTFSEIEMNLIQNLDLFLHNPRSIHFSHVME